MIVAIQGLDTSFHAEAAKQLFGNEITILSNNTFKEVFAALETGKATYAVVAIENSLYGSINQVYDLLLQHNFTICNEAYEIVELHLLGTPGATLHDITDVYSQAPALAEADKFLDTQLPQAERHEHADTALAAQEVQQWADTSKAAIASQAAGRKYNLTFLAKNIETHPENYTRFIALSSTAQSQPIENCKSSIIFETADAPGSLHDALGVFASRGINLTKLESRPIIGKVWQYMYYVDFVGDFTDDIRTDLERHAHAIRLLGTYPQGKHPST